MILTKIIFYSFNIQKVLYYEEYVFEYHDFNQNYILEFQHRKKDLYHEEYAFEYHDFNQNYISEFQHTKRFIS